MRPIDYLLDRAALLLAFAGALLFLLLVVHLGYVALRPGDALYVLLLAGTLTGAILIVDYRRQRHFRRAVARDLLRDDDASGDLAHVPGAVTREQRALNRLLEHRHRRYADELRAYRERATTHRTFVDAWVHQLKTPLSVLELTVQEAQRGGDVASPEAWASVAEEVDAIAEGVEVMLTLARLDGFEVDVRPTQVDLAVAAREAVNGLKRSWIRHGVFPRVVAPPEPVVVESDAKWLAAILRQLLTNALKYSAVGDRAARGDEGAHAAAPTVVVEVVALEDGAQLVVEDTGIGIPEEDVPRVFERFFTGANGRAGRVSTGMGLYLTSEIVRRLGHRIELTSVRGQGTRVSLQFSSRGVHRLPATASTGKVTRSSPSRDRV